MNSFKKSEDGKYFEVEDRELKEPELEEECVKNIEVFLDLYHIKNQVIIPNVFLPNKRADHLCVDYNWNPVLIEYKVTEKNSILDQTPRYKLLLLTTNAKYELTQQIINTIKEKQGIELSINDINWKNLRVICFSTFSKEQKFSIMYDKRYKDLEFIEYHLIGSDYITLDYISFKEIIPKWDKEKKVFEPAEIPEEEVEDLSIKLNEKIAQLQNNSWPYSEQFKKLIDWVLNTVSPNIIPKYIESNYIPFNVGSRKVFDVQYNDSKLIVVVNVPDKTKVKYIPDIVIDYSSNGTNKMGKGTTIINIRNDENLEEAKKLILQKAETLKNLNIGEEISEESSVNNGE